MARNRTRKRSAGRNRKRAKGGPRICVDEHIHAGIAGIFRRRFMTIEVAKTREFRGRDEKDFLPILFQRNMIFVTSDSEFVDYVVDHDPEHAGIVYIPPNMDEESKIWFAQVAVAWINGGTRHNPTAHRGVTIYPASDGVRFFRRRGSHDKSNFRTELGISWDEIDE